MSSVAARPDVTGTVEQVMSGELFSGLLLDGTDQRAAALEAVLGNVVDEDTRVTWVANPLRSPLTIERFLIQIVGPSVDLREEHGPAELARIIARPVGRETRLLVVVQQPETIDGPTRDLLVAMGGYLGGEAVQVQFLFTGASSFIMPRLPTPRIAAFVPQDTLSASSAPRRRDVLPLIVLLLTLTLGVVISMAPVAPEANPRLETATPPPVVPEPAHASDILPLQREFNDFLADRASSLPVMTDAQKDALFTEFLTHHHRK